MAELVKVEGLEKFFKTPKGMLHAVDGVNMTFEAGKTMGVVGESGCGKSTLGRTIIHLQEPTGGKMYFEGEDITSVSRLRLRKLRESMQIIFQDPYASLNPRMTVEDTIREPLTLSGRVSTGDLQAEIKRLMDLVGIDKRMRMAYPHEIDGGRRQRVGIARALAMNPKFIVCDEPVSALDVSIQAQVINLLMDLQKEFGLTYMFVTHDLSVVRHISHNISVMYLGQVVEVSPAKELFVQPLHPYTRALLSAIPSTNIYASHDRILLKGEISSPIEPRPGCRFARRCGYCTEGCFASQTLTEVSPGHKVACWRAVQAAQEAPAQNPATDPATERKKT